MYLRVVKSRKDAKDTCDVNLANDDLKWMKHVVGNVSCLPTFWKSVFHDYDNFGLCTSKKKYEEVARFLALKNAYGRNLVFEKYQPPCQSMRVLANTNTDRYKEEEIFKIKFRFRYLKNI